MLKAASFECTYNLAVLIGFLTSLCFELVQLWTALGWFDVTDLIVNVGGTAVGMAIALRFKGEKSNKVFNVLSLVWLVLLTPLAIFGLVQTIETWPEYEGLLYQGFALPNPFFLLHALD